MLKMLSCKVLDDRLYEWGMPTRATDESAGIDLRACVSEPTILRPQEGILIPTGLAVDINDPSVAMLLMPRSGLGHKRGIVLGNGVGLIDSDYHGQVFVSAWNRMREDTEPYVIEPGEFICQAVFVSVVQVELCPVDEFERSTKRGSGGFGHSGRR